MNRYLKNARKNLLPLSLDTSTFENASKEWYATGACHYVCEENEACELCEHDDLQKQFEIKNQHNNNVLWVGSKCICRFKIIVYDESGLIIADTQKEDYLKKHFKNRIIRQFIDFLIQKNNNTEMQGHTRLSLDRYCLDFFLKSKTLTPKITNYLFKRFEEENIIVTPFFFRPKIQGHKHEFIQLSQRQFERIRTSLNPNQIASYEKYHQHQD